MRLNCKVSLGQVGCTLSRSDVDNEHRNGTRTVSTAFPRHMQEQFLSPLLCTELVSLFYLCELYYLALMDDVMRIYIFWRRWVGMDV